MGTFFKLIILPNMEMHRIQTATPTRQSAGEGESTVTGKLALYVPQLTLITWTRDMGLSQLGIRVAVVDAGEQRTLQAEWRDYQPGTMLQLDPQIDGLYPASHTGIIRITLLGKDARSAEEILGSWEIQVPQLPVVKEQSWNKRYFASIYKYKPCSLSEDRVKYAELSLGAVRIL